MNIYQYIDVNLPKCIRQNKEYSGTFIGLPYPYICPCAAGAFQEMYYWDTYFTHKGLLIRGELQQVRHDIDNMCYLIQKYGFVLNGNRTNYLYNSQPPFLSMMVRDYYEVNPDKEWLIQAYDALKKEHDFWMQNRGSEIGLNRYDWMPMPEDMHATFAGYLRGRLGECDITSDEEAARGLISSGESGWDLNPRMGAKSYEFAPADLNSLLYALEENLSYFASELGQADESAKWHKLGEERAALCRKYLKNADGLYMDYNFVQKEQTTIFSVASFYPLFCGMATQEEAEAARKALYRLETDYGVVTCEKNDAAVTYQWDYPNGWAPMQLIVVSGLLRYGYEQDALRIARKFVQLVERCYSETNHLWEKYNIVEGNVNAQNEYEMPPMLGWTFGVYTWLKELERVQDV